MKRSIRVLTIAVLPMCVLMGCQSGRATQSATGGVAPSARNPAAPPADRFSSADQERTMVSEMNLNRPGDPPGQTASERDNMALRNSLAGKPHRSLTTQATDSTTNEMPGGKGLPRTTEEAIIEPRDRSSEEVGLRQGAGAGIAGIAGYELGVADIGPYEADFRQNYEANHANSGYGYDQYRPAYQYGFGLAKDPRYAMMDWNELEMQAHRNWNEGTMGPWDRYKDAVRYGWERGRAATPGQG